MKTLCLTLRETPEIEARARKHFAERGVWEVTYIYGIHAAKAGLLTSNFYEVDNPGTNYTIGPKGVGIWVSFIMLFQIAAQMEGDHFIILEHDCELDPNWKARTEQAFKDVPPDFDFLFIGSCCLNSDKLKTKVKGEVWKVHSPNCNHFMIVAKKCLPFVIKQLSRKCWAPLDIHLIFECFPHLGVYALIPRAAKQFDSYIPE